MTTINCNDLPLSSVKKCEKFRKLIFGKDVPLDKTGGKLPNQLVQFLSCQIKNSPIPTCQDVMHAYEKCHNSVMGTGSYPLTGRKHCGVELSNMYNCVMENSNN